MAPAAAFLNELGVRIAVIEDVPEKEHVGSEKDLPEHACYASDKEQEYCPVGAVER